MASGPDTAADASPAEATDVADEAATEEADGGARSEARAIEPEEPFEATAGERLQVALGNYEVTLEVPIAATGELWPGRERDNPLLAFDTERDVAPRSFGVAAIGGYIDTHALWEEPDPFFRSRPEPFVATDLLEELQRLQPGLRIDGITSEDDGTTYYRTELVLDEADEATLQESDEDTLAAPTIAVRASTPNNWAYLGVAEGSQQHNAIVQLEDGWFNVWADEREEADAAEMVSAMASSLELADGFDPSTVEFTPARPIDPEAKGPQPVPPGRHELPLYPHPVEFETTADAQTWAMTPEELPHPEYFHLVVAVDEPDAPYTEVEIYSIDGVVQSSDNIWRTVSVPHSLAAWASNAPRHGFDDVEVADFDHPESDDAVLLTLEARTDSVFTDHDAWPAVFNRARDASEERFWPASQEPGTTLTYVAMRLGETVFVVSGPSEHRELVEELASRMSPA